MDHDPNDPWYEAEDCGCSCNDDGMESEWEWNAEIGCYVCISCGEEQ